MVSRREVCSCRFAEVKTPSTLLLVRQWSATFLGTAVGAGLLLTLPSSKNCNLTKQGRTPARPPAPPHHAFFKHNTQRRSIHSREASVRYHGDSCFLPEVVGVCVQVHAHAEHLQTHLVDTETIQTHPSVELSPHLLVLNKVYL